MSPRPTTAPTPTAVPRWPLVPLLLAVPLILAAISQLPVTMNREVHSVQLPQSVDRMALFFGYVDCPAVCPTTMSALRQVYLQYSEDPERASLGVTFVNLAPPSGAQVADYAAHFHPDFFGLQANAADRGAFMRELGVRFDRSAAGPAGWHTDSIYLLRREAAVWRVRRVVRSPIEPQQVVALLQEI